MKYFFSVPKNQSRFVIGNVIVLSVVQTRQLHPKLQYTQSISK